METKIAQIIITKTNLRYMMDLEDVDKKISPEEYFKGKVINIDSPFIGALIDRVPTTKSGGVLVYNEIDTTATRLIWLDPKESKYRNVLGFGDLYKCACLARMIDENTNVASNILILSVQQDSLSEAFKDFKNFDNYYKDKGLYSDKEFLDDYDYYKEFMLTQAIKENNIEIVESLIKDYKVNPIPSGKNYQYLLECIKYKFIDGVKFFNENTMLSLDNISMINTLFALNDLDFIKSVRLYHKQYTGFDFDDKEIIPLGKLNYLRTKDYDRKE